MLGQKIDVILQNYIRIVAMEKIPSQLIFTWIKLD